MVLDSDGVYGKEPKSAIPKRKKRRVTSPVRSTSSFGSGASVGSSHVTHYDPPSIPTSVSPPSYFDYPSLPSSTSTPKKSKPKKPKERKPKPEEEAESGLEWLRKLLSGETLESRKQKKPVVEDTNPFVQFYKDTLPDGVVSGKAKPDRGEKLAEFLKNFANPTAPPGSIPEVPDRIKQRKNGQLKRWWDEDYIKGVYESGNQFDINTLLENQFQDREDFMLRRSFNRSTKIQDVLKAASKAARTEDGEPGNFSYLSDYMEKHPKFSLDPVRFRDVYGETSDDLYDAWVKEREGLDPETQKYAKYRVDMLMRHYDKVQRSMQRGNFYIRRAIENYEKKYNESVEFAENNSDSDVQRAAKEAGPAIPNSGASDEEVEQYDEITRDTSSLAQLLGAPLGEKRNRAFQKKVRQDDRERVKEALGVKTLPSMKQMLAAKVADGTLDPRNQDDVDAWIERFKNVDHPETRAMYVAYAHIKDPEFDVEGLGSDFINEPIDAYIRAEQERVERAEGGGSGGPIPGLGQAQRAFGLLGGGDSPVNKGTNLVGWTLDKLSRPVYGLTAAMNTIYQADKQPTKSWTGDEGFLGSAISAVVDPLSLLTGKSVLDSADEIIQDPSILLDAGKAAYDEDPLLGIPLPGSDSDNVPITFSQVIANNAARDGEGDIYDKEWFQHVSGFALDVGMDPLNFIGVGLVNNTLKLPVKVTKGLGKGLADEATRIPVDEVLRWKNRPDSSPAAEKVFNVNQGMMRLGDELDGTEIVSDTQLYPEGIFIQKRQFPEDDGLTTAPFYFGIEFADKAPLRRELNKQKELLKAQENKVANDTGLAHLLEQSQTINDELGTIVTTPIDIKTSRIIAQTTIPISYRGKPSKYFNEGGAIWQRFLDPVDRYATSKGFSETRFANTERGIKAREAIEGKYLGRNRVAGLNELQELIAQGKLDPNSPATKKQLESLQYHIDRGHEVDPLTGKPSIENVPNRERVLREGVPKTGFDVVSVFAKAHNMSRDDFIRSVATEEELHEALLLGPELYTRSDPEAAKAFVDAQSRIQGAKANLARLPDNPVGDQATALHLNLQALAIGYSQMSQITVSGALRYLGDLHQAKLAGQVPTGEIDELERFRDLAESKLAEAEEGEGYAAGDPIEFLLNQSNNKEMMDSLLEAMPETGTDVEKLQAMVDTLDTTIDNLRLQQTTEVTGLPPAVVYQVENLLPVSSVFRSADGLNMERIRKAFTFEPKHNKYSYKRSDDYQPGDYAFLDVLRGALTHEYLGAYRGESMAARKVKATDETSIEGVHVKKFLEDRGERPTSASMAENFPAVYARMNKKAKVNRIKYERELRDIDARADADFDRLDAKFTKQKDINERYPLDHPDKVDPYDLQQAFDTQRGYIDAQHAKKVEALKEKYGIGNEEVVIHNVHEQDSIEDALKDVTNKPTVSGGKRTKGQKDWERLVKTRQREWDRDFTKAQEADAKGAEFRKSQEPVEPGQTAGEIRTIKRRAADKAEQGVFESLERAGTIKRVPANERITINAQADAIKKKAKLETRAQQIDLKIKELEASSAAQVKELRAQQAALNTKLRRLYDKVEKHRIEAINTAKVVKRRVGEEHLLQLFMAPGRMDGRMLQVQLLGMRKNLQFTHSMFKGAAKAAELLPAKVRESYANYLVRPTKKLNQHESIHFRAIWESQTPFIIKSHLSRLAHRMDGIPETERHNMMHSYRNGVDYDGPSANLYEGVVNELKEIEDIFSGNHDFYQFKERGKSNIESLVPYEIMRFLPKEWQPSLSVLYRSRGQAGRQNFTIDDIVTAIRARGNRPEGLTDPFRLSWVMTLAADQARQLRTIHNLIKSNFGVEIPYAGSKGQIRELATKRKLIEKLKDQYGWKEVSELPGYVFPPESHKDIRELLEMLQPGKAHNDFMKMVDTIIGYWKQGMTIYNPGYYTRNGVGEIMASWLDGVNHPKWYRMAYRAHKFIKGTDQNLSDLMKKWSVLEGKIEADPAKPTEVLFSLKGGTKIRVEDLVREYNRLGLSSTFANTDLNRGVRSLAGSSLTDSTLRKTARKVNEWTHGVGEGFEDYLRMAHFAHAMQHSGKGSIRAAAEYAATRVTRSHFDYTDFSKFEQAVMLRAFPFYKWTRRGAPLMIAHLFMTPGKMTALPKAMDAMSGLGLDPMGLVTDDPLLSTQDVHEDKNGFLPNYTGIAPAWVKDLFAYQMQPAPDDEYANYFRLQTPQLDGLNTALSLVPREGNNLLDLFGDSTAYPLLNPAVKMTAELSRNQGLDPDFPYEIYGGDYNEMNGLNPAESIAIYAARNLNPLTGFLAKLSKNGDLGPLSMGEGEYRDSKGYDASRDVASFFTGAGFYQGRTSETTEATEEANNLPPVDRYNLSQLPMFRGAPAAPKSHAKGYKGTGYDSTVSAGYDNSGYANYFYNNYGDYGGYGYSSYGGYGGGYGGGSSSYSPSISSSSGSMEFWELLQRLKEMVDQGKVVDDD